MTIKQRLSRTAARVAVMAMVGLGAATMAATSAQAAPETNHGAGQSAGVQAIAAAANEPIIHDQSGLCLDGSVSQGIRLNRCNGTSYQGWSASGYYLIHDKSGLCLDGSASQGVRLNTCKWNSYQRWSTTDGYKLRHAQSGLCLDGSVSQGVRLNTCNFTTYQDWAVVDA